MQISGYIKAQGGSPVDGYFGATDAKGVILFGPTPTDPGGAFEMTVQPGQYMFFGAHGYVDQTVLVVDAPESLVVYLGKQNYLLPIGLMVIGAWLFYKNSRGKKRVGSFDVKKDLVPVFWIVGGVIGFTVIKKLLEKLGVWQDADAKALDQAATDPNSFWSPTFWQRSQNYSYAIDTATAQAFAKNLYDAFGIFNDDEDAAINVFRQLKTKANVSYLAYVFAQQYNQDLLTFLRGGMWPQDRLSDADVNTINKLISSLPDF